MVPPILQCYAWVPLTWPVTMIGLFSPRRPGGAHRVLQGLLGGRAGGLPAHRGQAQRRGVHAAAEGVAAHEEGAVRRLSLPFCILGP